MFVMTTSLVKPIPPYITAKASKAAYPTAKAMGGVVAKKTAALVKSMIHDNIKTTAVQGGISISICHFLGKYRSFIEFTSVCALGIIALKAIGKFASGALTFEENLAKAEKGDLQALRQISSLKVLLSRSPEEQRKVYDALFSNLANDATGQLFVHMALMQYLGSGVAKDLKLAELYLKKGVDKGNVDAMHGLCFLYERAGDQDKVIEYLGKAAEANDRSAMEGLLGRYRDGRGVPKNSEKEEYWRQKILNYVPA